MDGRSGIVAAFGAALLYNLATVLQKSQAQREAVEGIRLVARLFTRPLWLLGAGPAATLGWMVAFGLIVVGIVVLSGSAQVVATLADRTP